MLSTDETEQKWSYNPYKPNFEQRIEPRNVDFIAVHPELPYYAFLHKGQNTKKKISVFKVGQERVICSRSLNNKREPSFTAKVCQFLPSSEHSLKILIGGECKNCNGHLPINWWQINLKKESHVTYKTSEYVIGSDENAGKRSLGLDLTAFMVSDLTILANKWC